MVRLAQELRDSGIHLDHIDIGGGLGISYDGSRVPTRRRICGGGALDREAVGPGHCARAGRFIVGAAGALLARVDGCEGHAAAGHHFAVLDAGMTELMRPALYGSFHRIEPVTPRSVREASLRHRRAGL